MPATVNNDNVNAYHMHNLAVDKALNSSLTVSSKSESSRSFGVRAKAPYPFHALSDRSSPLASDSHIQVLNAP